LAVPLGGGSAATWAEGSEQDVVILRYGIEGRFALKFEDEVFLHFLRGPASRDDLDLRRFGPEVVLDRADKAAGVTLDVCREIWGGVSIQNDGVFGG
jgi:hypothetical protein